MFADALASTGRAVAELPTSPWRYRRGGGTVILHWPDEFFASGSAHFEARAWALLAQMILCRRVFGQRIVWVVHNLRPHDLAGTANRRTARFLRILDGAIYLSDASKAAAIGQYPALARVPSLVVAHGDYYSVERSPAHPPPAIGDRPVRLALTGQIRRYKGADVLARAAKALPAGTTALTIAGRCDDDGLAAELRAAADAMPGTDLRFSYLDPEALEAVIDGADAVVLPYRAILNSGSALYALSRARPVIAPRLGSLAELQAQAGSDWLYLYDGELDADVLARAIRWIAETPRRAMPDLSAHRWPDIGASIDAFLKTLG